MDPRKKDRLQTPETITSSAEDESSTCSEAEENSCPKSGVSKSGDSASC